MASVRVDGINDPRFKILGKLINSNRFDALGRMVAVWEYCTEKQTYFLTEIILDAISEIENFADALTKSDLAERTDEGIRIKGTKGRIEWLRKLRQNGKKGGRPKKTKTKPDGNQKETKFEPPSNPLTLTIAPSLTLTPSPELKNIAQGSSNPDAEQETFFPENQENNRQGKPPPGGKESLDPEGPSSTALTWRSYKEAYKQEYGEPPPWNAKIGGQLKSFVGRVQSKEAPLIAAFYLTHGDQVYKKAMHPVGLLLRDAEKLRTEWATGRKMTGAQAKQSEQKDANVEAMKTYLARKGITHDG